MEYKKLTNLAFAVWAYVSLVLQSNEKPTIVGPKTVAKLFMHILFISFDSATLKNHYNFILEQYLNKA